jgi:hypothetical protein
MYILPQQIINKISKKRKKEPSAWLMAVISATWEVDIRRIMQSTASADKKLAGLHFNQ